MFGLETSPNFINLVKKKIKKNNVKSNLNILKNSEKLPYKKNFFDNIVCISVLSQLKTKKNVGHLLREFLRVLKKGGNLIIDINGPKSGHFFNKNDYFSLKSKQGFVKLLKQNKFKVLSSGEVFTSYLTIKDHEFILIARKI